VKRTYYPIDWELDEIIDRNIDGSGTNEVRLIGCGDCAEGGGKFRFEATAQMPYPFDGEFTEIEITDTEFIADEPEPEDAE
jgi:hypothetical protein